MRPPKEFLFILPEIAGICIIDKNKRSIRQEPGDKLGLVLNDTPVAGFVESPASSGT